MRVEQTLEETRMTSFRIDALRSSVLRRNIVAATLRPVLALGLIAGAAAAFGGGCSSGIDLSTEEAFCQARAQTECTQTVVSTCFDETNPNALSQDTQTCQTAVQSLETCNPESRIYHAAFAQGCLNAIGALYATAPNLDPSAYAAQVQACNAVFNNGGQTGAPCQADTDCDVGDGFACITHAGGTGSCQVPQPIQPGESCSFPAAQCTSGFFCEDSGHCVSNPTIGQSCGPGIACDQTSFCDVPSSGGTAGTCKALLPDQSPCTEDGQCSGGFCVTVNSGSLCAGGPAPLAFDTPACHTFTN